MPVVIPQSTRHYVFYDIINKMLTSVKPQVLYFILRIAKVNMRVTPLPHCVLRTASFKLAYCVRSNFGLAYCVPFNNKNNFSLASPFIKKNKNTFCGMQKHTLSCKS